MKEDEKMEKEVLELFKAMVVVKSRITDEPNLDNIDLGLVLNFKPSNSQLATLKEYYKPLEMKTLFTREKRDNADPFDLITTQLLHYIEVYGLGMPGIFDLDMGSGTLVTMNFVRGVTVPELGDMVRELLYANAPVKDAEAVTNIINHYKIDYDVNKIANNELRVSLFDAKKDTFTDGDDVVRFMCLNATGQSMLIKSPEVVAAVATQKLPASFYARHEDVLAQVFNRHKRLIMAAKNNDTKTIINRISRKSKTMHVPLREAVNKTFVAGALNGTIDLGVLDKISLRDKFKYLNLLSYKREQSTVDAFIIRNGKMHIKTDRKVYDEVAIARVEQAVLDSIKVDLSALADKRILLDGKVRYGLPVSRNQTIGQLPFGTKVAVDSDRISSGIYWENSWGAYDLDLSTIDVAGNRTGWGQFSGYSQTNSVTFSGDVTDARSGAMEFMTSAGVSYALFVNIYSGNTGCDMEIVVGDDADGSKWISDVKIREKMTLNSRGMLVGFVRNGDFVVYAGRLSNGRVNKEGCNPVIGRGMSDFWTINDLFDMLGIDYDVDKDTEKTYDYDLTYQGFSFDKLEELLK